MNRRTAGEEELQGAPSDAPCVEAKFSWAPARVPCAATGAETGVGTELRRPSLRLHFIFGCRLRLLNIDAALEERAIVDGDARGRNVACQRSALAQLDPLGGMNVAVDPAVHDYIAGFNIGAYAAVGANGQALPLAG